MRDVQEKDKHKASENRKRRVRTGKERKDRGID